MLYTLKDYNQKKWQIELDPTETVCKEIMIIT